MVFRHEFAGLWVGLEDIGRAALVRPVDVIARQHRRRANRTLQSLTPHFLTVTGAPAEEHSRAGQRVKVTIVCEHRLLVALLLVFPEDLAAGAGADGDRLGAGI